MVQNDSAFLLLRNCSKFCKGWNTCWLGCLKYYVGEFYHWSWKIVYINLVLEVWRAMDLNVGRWRSLTPDECRQQKWEWYVEKDASWWNSDGLLRNRTGVEDLENQSSGRDQTEMAWAPWKNGWNKFSQKSKGIRVPKHIKRGRPKNHGLRWWKRIWKREACASMMPKIETSGDDAAEEWSTPVNWEEDPAVKAERIRSHLNGNIKLFREPSEENDSNDHSKVEPRQRLILKIYNDTAADYRRRCKKSSLPIDSAFRRKKSFGNTVVWPFENTELWKFTSSSFVV